jgi:hypothetical protein
MRRDRLPLRGSWSFRKSATKLELGSEGSVKKGKLPSHSEPPVVTRCFLFITSVTLDDAMMREKGAIVPCKT